MNFIRNLQIHNIIRFKTIFCVPIWSFDKQNDKLYSTLCEVTTTAMMVATEVILIFFWYTALVLSNFFQNCLVAYIIYTIVGYYTVFVSGRSIDDSVFLPLYVFLQQWLSLHLFLPELITPSDCKMTVELLIYNSYSLF